MLERPLPNSAESERAVLGAIILDNTLIDQALAELSPDDFYIPSNRKIFTAMADLSYENVDINPIFVVDKLRANGESLSLSEVSNLSYGLHKFSNLKHYTNIIKDKSAKRRMYYALDAAMLEIEEDSEDAQDLISKHDARLDTIREEATTEHTGFKSAIDIAPILHQRLTDIKEGISFAISTGLPLLDQITRGGGVPGELWVWSALTGGGKALDVNTPILTEHGWKTMGTINIGDKVFDEKGNLCNIIATTDVMYGRPCYELVFSDGSKIVADAEHQWLTRTRRATLSEYNSKKYRNEDGSLKPHGTDYSYKRTHPSITTTEEMYISVDDGKYKNYSIKNCEALKIKDRNLPINPYVLGAWLGDGDSAGGRFTTADVEILEFLKQYEHSTIKHKQNYSYGISNLQTKLRALNLLKNKHIPEEYLLASYSQRLELLQGLLDTDGSVNLKGSVEFSNSNLLLSEGVAFLANSLGIKAVVRQNKSFFKDKQCQDRYRVKFTTTLPVFKLKRKLERLPTELRKTSNYRYITEIKKIESVPVRCIEVDSSSHLFLAGKTLIPTHNSALMKQIAQNCVSRGIPVGIVTAEMSDWEVMMRMLADIAKVPAWTIQTNVLREEQFERLEQGLVKLAGQPLWIDDRTTNIYEIRARVKSLVRAVIPKSQPIQDRKFVLFVDYLQLLEVKSEDFSRFVMTRAQEVAKVSRVLKKLAKELNIWIFALAQFNRTANAKDETGQVRPEIHQLAESSGLEKDADLVGIIDMPEYIPGQAEREVALRIGKNRNAPPLSLPYIFNGDYMNFRERDGVVVKKKDVRTEMMDYTGTEVASENIEKDDNPLF
jgi:replicative DNA helicase